MVMYTTLVLLLLEFLLIRLTKNMRKERMFKGCFDMRFLVTNVLETMRIEGKSGGMNLSQ